MEKPDIFIERKAWDQITAAVQFQDLEVMFFGRGSYVSNDDRGSYILHEIIIPPQEVSGAFTDTGEAKQNVENLNFIISEAMRLGLPISGWGFWGHSHVNMGTTPSGTDRDTMRDLAEQWSGRAIGAVFNQKGEVTAWGVGTHPMFPDRYIDMQPGALKVAIEGITYPEIPEVAEWMKNVTKKVYQYQGGYSNVGKVPVLTLTECEKAASKDEPPSLTTVLTTHAFNVIKASDYYEEQVDAVEAKFKDPAIGWKGLNALERMVALVIIDEDNWKAPRQLQTSYANYGWDDPELAAYYGYDE